MSNEIKKLEVINAATKRTTQHGEYTLEITKAVGRIGRQRAGSHMHFLTVYTIIADTNETPGFKEYNGKRFRVMKVGDVFSASAPCNGNGQHIGLVSEGLDTDAITCKTCRKMVEAVSANIEREEIA